MNILGSTFGAPYLRKLQFAGRFAKLSIVARREWRNGKEHGTYHAIQCGLWVEGVGCSQKWRERASQPFSCKAQSYNSAQVRSLTPYKPLMSLWNHGPLMFKSSNSTWPGAWWCLTPRKRRRDKIFMGAWWRRDRGEIELYATADQKQAICDCHQELSKLPTQEGSG